VVATVHTSGGILFLAVFAACSVEMVEALTIVVAVGVSRGWRIALLGAFSAVAALCALVAAVGPAIIHYVPLNALRIVIGLLLLAVGANWLRKAVLRASGRKAQHDEDAIYAATVEELAEEDKPSGFDVAGFAVSFKGVFLEGVEVVIIVLTLGAASHDLALATVAAAAAFLLVAVVGLLVARQLSEVPENALKMAVGLMLMSFGTFWLGEGLGLAWPGHDLALLVLLCAYGVLAATAVRVLRRSRRPTPA